MSQGFVYILISANSKYIKIGGTKKPISERIREINSSASYGEHGPWALSDFLHVKDWHEVEGGLHRHFKKKRIGEISTRELFDVAPYDARKQLRRTSVVHRVDHDETEQVFKNRDLKLYLFKLFQMSGLFGCLDIQGAAWTLNLSGRFSFILNIGPHGFAFSERKAIDSKFRHYLSVDRLIRDYQKTNNWIKKHNGGVMERPYFGAKRQVQIYFDADFAGAEAILEQPGVRRALVAYWFDRLADLRERDAKSKYWRHHSYDAVSDLMEYRYAMQNIFYPNKRFGGSV